MNAIVIGGGPAAVAAGIALRCEGIETMVIGDQFHPRCHVSPRIENIPGAGTVSGTVYSLRLHDQLTGFGASLINDRVTALVPTGDGKIGVSTKRRPFLADVIILATGMTLLDDPHPFPTLLPRVFVQGGGDAAVQCALGHANSLRATTLVVRGQNLDSCSAYLRKRLESHHYIEVMYEADAAVVEGKVHLRDLTSGKVRVQQHTCLQSLLGASPSTDWLPEGIYRDTRGFIITGNSNYPFMTNMVGVFAAGDVRSGSIKRVAVAQGEGVSAGHHAAAWLRRKETT